MCGVSNAKNHVGSPFRAKLRIPFYTKAQPLRKRYFSALPPAPGRESMNSLLVCLFTCGGRSIKSKLNSDGPGPVGHGQAESIRVPRVAISARVGSPGPAPRAGRVTGNGHGKRGPDHWQVRLGVRGSGSDAHCLVTVERRDNHGLSLSLRVSLSLSLSLPLSAESPSQAPGSDSDSRH